MARYIWYVFLSLAATLVSLVFLAWWSPLLTNSAGNLPAFLYWQQTFDSTLDAGWKDGYYPAKWGNSFWTLYWARVCWLYRNNCYAFQYFQLGRDFDPALWTIVLSNGTWFIATGPNGLFCVEYGGTWGSYKFGWKALNYTDVQTRTKWLDPSYKWGPLRRVPVCFTINPFRR